MLLKQALYYLSPACFLDFEQIRYHHERVPVESEQLWGLENKEQSSLRKSWDNLIQCQCGR
jgi:hypothetical protein